MNFEVYNNVLYNDYGVNIQLLYIIFYLCTCIFKIDVNLISL